MDEDCKKEDAMLMSALFGVYIGSTVTLSLKNAVRNLEWQEKILIGSLKDSSCLSEEGKAVLEEYTSKGTWNTKALLRVVVDTESGFVPEFNEFIFGDVGFERIVGMIGTLVVGIVDEKVYSTLRERLDKTNTCILAHFRRLLRLFVVVFTALEFEKQFFRDAIDFFCDMAVAGKDAVCLCGVGCQCQCKATTSDRDESGNSNGFPVHVMAHIEQMQSKVETSMLGLFASIPEEKTHPCRVDKVRERIAKNERLGPGNTGLFKVEREDIKIVDQMYTKVEIVQMCDCCG